MGPWGNSLSSHIYSHYSLLKYLFLLSLGLQLNHRRLILPSIMSGLNTLPIDSLPNTILNSSNGETSVSNGVSNDKNSTLDKTLPTNREQKDTGQVAMDFNAIHNRLKQARRVKTLNDRTLPRNTAAVSHARIPIDKLTSDKGGTYCSDNDELSIRTAD